MELTAYPGMPAHKVSHQELREGLSQQLERHRQGLDSAVGVLELLDRWTLQHLTCEDFELASYLWIQE
jgi:hemerythrin